MTSVFPTFVCVGSIFIDDIVYPDGRTYMETLGGGGVHAAAGMLVWGERAGLAAAMGMGIPQSALNRLQRDFDLQGVITLDLPQIRAWQIFEWDGTRTEIMRVDRIDPFLDEPTPEQCPQVYREAKGATIYRDAREFLRWRDVFPQAALLWEPEQAYMIPDNADEFRQTLPCVDIVSPNLLEASLVYDSKDPHELAGLMVSDGAQIAVLRMGDTGSIVARKDEQITIPAVPVPKVVDQTGAGNTYCGAFVVGWQRTHNLRIAGYYGAVAASFSIEQVGVLATFDTQERDRRYRWLEAHTRL
jgi:sugar/nucleoside kinase (ribokinase family)